MEDSASQETATSNRDRGGHAGHSEHLHKVIHHAAHLLPAQGPITVFIHQNTLHAFEDLPFSEAVKKGANIFGCQPYLTEDRFREALARGRIRFDTLQVVLQLDLGTTAFDPIPCFGTRQELRLSMLEYPLRTGPTEELIWYVSETNALRKVRAEASSATRSKLIAETHRWVLRDLRSGYDPTLNDSVRRTRAARPVSESLSELLDRFGESTIEDWTDDDWEGFALQALWRVCCDGVRNLPPYTAPPEPPLRHRDLLLEATGEDSDAPVHDLLIRFCAAFLDQGLANWALPGRERGFYQAFCSLYRQAGPPPERWMRGLGIELARLQDDRIGPLESIEESLRILGVSEFEWCEYISSTFLALRGWGGMIHQLEMRGDRATIPVAEGSLAEFLAVRLILDRFSLAHAAKEALKYIGPLSELRVAACAGVGSSWPPSVEQRAFVVFQLAQLRALSPDNFHKLTPKEWALLVSEIERFSALERRRIFHLAYEQRFTTQTLDAISLHGKSTAGRPATPRFQLVCCLDEREESFRRHLEELVPSVETFGAAGFYSIAMYYRGAADANFVPLCPFVIRPRHWVTEEVGDAFGDSDRRRKFSRRALGTASYGFHIGSRSFALGALLTGAVGVLASVPLVARILFPRLTAQTRSLFGRIVRTPPATRLHLERLDETAGQEGGQIGFSVAEMTVLGERLLRDMGLISGFSRLLILLGHGSNSLNNPHDSAHNCGACGGGEGGPNARAMAQILNDKRVRDGLDARGLHISADTLVVGGYHNTCNESVTFHDLDRIPGSHQADFESARRAIEIVCSRNAHERCRRFMSAPLTLSYTGAREHVEERSEDLAQTRPEFGHATNAITIVGRRAWSRGLFLDRRAFLTSYDPTQDDENASILTRILQAVFPVCAGISLEYYFSHVDNAGFGCGTKLPHNIAALLGVMDGAASDLRTGLPWQMVEIHEPMRSLFVIETTPEKMTAIMDKNEGIGRLCRNSWIQLALIDPVTKDVSQYRGGTFERYRPQSDVLPRAASSVDWYRGWRDHLEFAEIES